MDLGLRGHSMPPHNLLGTFLAPKPWILFQGTWENLETLKWSDGGHPGLPGAHSHIYEATG